MRKSTPSADQRRLRALLLDLRKQAGLSQRDLAARINVAPSWVAKVELGERRLDLIEFGWICQACDVSASDAAVRFFAESRPASRLRRSS